MKAWVHISISHKDLNNMIFHNLEIELKFTLEITLQTEMNIICDSVAHGKYNFIYSICKN
jgi:hypothetical protein